MNRFEEYQMPEFAVVGNTAYIAPNTRDSAWASYRKVTITKVLKRQVVVEWTRVSSIKGDSPEAVIEARFSVENWGQKLREVSAGKDKYDKSLLISEADGLARIARKDASKRLDVARAAVSNAANHISARQGRDLSVGILDERMNMLKTAAEEFTAAQMAWDELQK